MVYNEKYIHTENSTIVRFALTRSLTVMCFDMQLLLEKKSRDSHDLEIWSININ